MCNLRVMVVPPASPLSSFVLSCLFPFSRTKSSFLLAASLFSLAISFPAIALNIRPIPSCPPFSAAPYRDIARHTLFGEEEGEADENPGEGAAAVLLLHAFGFGAAAVGRSVAVGRIVIIIE